MKLKNNALQKLFDEFANFKYEPGRTNIIMAMYEMFVRCDEELARETEKLKKHLEVAVKETEKLRREVSTKDKRNNDLQKQLLEQAGHTDRDLEKDIKRLRSSRLDWAKRACDRRKERDDAREKCEKLSQQLMETTETLEKVNSDRNSYHGLYTELRKDYDKLFEENRKLKARTDCHRYEVEWYRKHYKEQSDKIKELKKQLEELTSQYQKLTIENKRLQNNVRSGYDQGQTDLWVALQNVNNSQPLELATCFPDVTGMEDILNWDLEDFLDAYKKWLEEKEKERFDHMRDYLARFCEGRVCEACPLGSNEYKCGCGYSFKKSADWDMRIIPDEELERYYEKARGCGAYNLKDGKLFIHDLSHPMAGVNEAIKNACEKFTKAVEAANINISTRAWHGDAIAEKIKIEPWSCTLEGTINIEFDRDLLEKVCGVKPDDK